MRDALMTATERLCAERSPAQVSVREIADEAGVNHGQVHHYFGSKEELIVATLERIEAAFIDQMGEEYGFEISSVVHVAAARPAFNQMLAWLIIEGTHLKEVRRLKMGQALGRLFSETGRSDREAIVVATQVMAIVGGWTLYKPALVVANELDSGAIEAVEKSLARVVESVASPGADRNRTS